MISILSEIEKLQISSVVLVDQYIMVRDSNTAGRKENATKTFNAQSIYIMVRREIF